MTVKEKLKELNEHLYEIWQISIYSQKNGYCGLASVDCSDDIIQDVYDCIYSNYKCVDWKVQHMNGEEAIELLLFIE